MKTMKNILPFAALAGLALSANAAVISSFNLQGGVITGDMGGTNGVNDNGLQITGTTADWSVINTDTPSATNNGVTLTFVPTNGWQNTVGNRGTVGDNAIRIGSHMSGVTDIPWTITGLEANAFYDMTWYNKNLDQTRQPNTGVAGFDAGNGIGASGPWDADGDQNFLGVQADGSGTISGTWFLAGGAEDISAVAGVQIMLVPEPSTALLGGLGLLALLRRRR